MKYTFSSGVTVEGSYYEVVKVAKALGEPLESMYKSQTRGWISVEEMDTQHIKNALVKLSKEYLSKLAKESTEDFLRKYHNMGQQKQIKALLEELAYRS